MRSFHYFKLKGDEIIHVRNKTEYSNITTKKKTMPCQETMTSSMIIIE